MKLIPILSATLAAGSLLACSGTSMFGSSSDGLTESPNGGDGTMPGSDGPSSNAMIEPGTVQLPTDPGDEEMQNLPGTEPNGEGGSGSDPNGQGGSDEPGGEGGESAMGGSDAGGAHGEGGTSAGDYEPCAEKVCGERCTICDPEDEDCFETEVLKSCSAQGECHAGPADCGRGCESSNDCRLQTFAPQECDICTNSNEPRCDSVECIEGSCVTVPAEPCEHTRECDTAEQCGTGDNNLVAPPPDGDCKLCPNGDLLCPEARCVENQCSQLTPACPREADSCESNLDCPAILAPCLLCPDGVTAQCPTNECVEGKCVLTNNVCPVESPYDACEGKECGAECSACDPNNTTCFAPAVLMACNAEGQCVVKIDNGPACNL